MSGTVNINLLAENNFKQTIFTLPSNAYFCYFTATININFNFTASSWQSGCSIEMISNLSSTLYIFRMSEYGDPYDGSMQYNNSICGSVLGHSIAIGLYDSDVYSNINNSAFSLQLKNSFSAVSSISPTGNNIINYNVVYYFTFWQNFKFSIFATYF